MELTWLNGQKYNLIEYLRRPLASAPEIYMHRCLELAVRGQGRVAPNPLVGCVLVHNNEIISEGWHQKFGENHAERNAILAIENDPRLAECTLYVNLEPCSHHGKTPPCADLIVSSGIKKVVVGSPDPHEKVNGQGIAKLRAAGIEVIENILQKECDVLNHKFIYFHQNKKPWVILKWAESADGFMAPENKIQTQISGESARVLLHKWRSEEMAIAVGAGTVEFDKPRLDVRYWQGKNPMRFVLDGKLRNHYPYDDSPITVFNYSKNEQKELAQFVQIPENDSIPFVLDYLFTKNILSIMIEGGAETLQSFIDSDNFNEIRIIKSKNVRLEHGPKAPAIDIPMVHSEELENDIIYYYHKV